MVGTIKLNKPIQVRLLESEVPADVNVQKIETKRVIQCSFRIAREIKVEYMLQKACSLNTFSSLGS